MAKRIRRHFGAAFRAKVALAAVQGDRSLSELSSQFGVHATQVSAWKKQLLDNVECIFSEGNQREDREREALEAELYQQIGQLKMELEWLKKKAARFGG
jgi:transposase